MASISSLGIGSGLDVNSIISSIMNVEQIPMTKLQATGTEMQTRLSAFGQMQSLVSTFRDASAALAAASAYTVTKASSTNTDAVGASSTATAVAGTYSVSVSALASTQSTVSASGQFADSTAVVGTGSITVSLGTWDAGATSFTPKPGSTDIVIPVGASENTLGAIRDKINKANAGVSATLITDASGSRLAFQSTATGATNGFRVTVADDDANNVDGAGLSALAYDPPSGATQMALTQSAANTAATINGIAVTTEGTTLTNVVDGMTFVLSKVTTAPAIVGVTRNTDSVKKLLTDFVGAYNGLASFLTSTTKYDTDTKTGALLQGDALATGLQSQMRQMLGQPGSASSAFGTLSAIGIEFQKDGTVTLNDTKATAALTNLPELAKALSNVDSGDASKNGFAKKITAWADSLLATNGTLPSKTKSIQSQIASNVKDQQRLSDRLTATEARIKAQYSALDATMSNANALSKYMTQQIETWNKSTG
jgi:flagellar hook-associated protein 2